MTTEILPREKESVADVVDVLCDAFADYPVMRYVLGPENGDYETDLRKLIDLFVMARDFREEHLLGIRDGADLAAAAIVSRPDGSPAPAEFLEYRQRVWTELGAEAEARYEAFGQACAPFQPEVPHLHLNMIGVRAGAQGRGLGRELLEHVHQLSVADSESHGVSLTTEVEANIVLYEHFGYRLVGQARVSPELRSWGFWRPD